MIFKYIIQEKMKNEKGITLIGLVVIIVVLLILAGVTITGTIQGVGETKENKLLSELEMVQHAVVERDNKYKLTNDDSLLVGTTVTSLPELQDGTKWKVYQFADTSNKEREYYRLSKSDLQDLGLTGDYQGSSYIVNYYSGEVYDETEQTTSSGTVLYKTAMENEASELGDEVIQDGLQVWYDAINNTGSGHSSTTTTWKDLSGNGNDAQITTTGSSLNWQSNCLATNKAESIITPWKFDTSHTISVVLEPLEFYNYNTIWENLDSVNDNEAWITEGGFLKTRSKSGNYYFLNHPIVLNKKISIDIVVDNEEQKCFLYISGISNSNISNGINLNGGKLIFNGGIQNTFGKNNYYSMKVYNRALSAAEVKHNYILDKARYGIEE